MTPGTAAAFVVLGSLLYFTMLAHMRARYPNDDNNEIASFLAVVIVAVFVYLLRSAVDLTALLLFPS